jgi:hypothetical protein
MKLFLAFACTTFLKYNFNVYVIHRCTVKTYYTVPKIRQCRGEFLLYTEAVPIIFCRNSHFLIYSALLPKKIQEEIPATLTDLWHSVWKNWFFPVWPNFSVNWQQWVIFDTVLLNFTYPGPLYAGLIDENTDGGNKNQSRDTAVSVSVRHMVNGDFVIDFQIMNRCWLD